MHQLTTLLNKTNLLVLQLSKLLFFSLLLKSVHQSNVDGFTLEF